MLDANDVETIDHLLQTRVSDPVGILAQDLSRHFDAFGSLAEDVTSIRSSVESEGSQDEQEAGTVQAVTIEPEQWDWVCASMRVQSTMLVLLLMMFCAVAGIQLWASFRAGGGRS